MTAAEIIKGISLFEGLAPAEIEGVLCVCERARFEPGACLMRQGQPADSAFILESGAVDVMTRLPGGGEAKVAALDPGSVIGEMALLDSGLRSATVVARGDAYSRWSDHGPLTAVLLAEEMGIFWIDHGHGRYHFTFGDIDRMRYCGMGGKINGYLTIRRANPKCELDGLMEQGPVEE